jgi:hypothetical protein
LQPAESEIENLREVFHLFNDEIQISSSVIDSNHFKVEMIPGGSSNINYRVSITKRYQRADFFVKFQSIPPVSRYYLDNLEREYDVTKFLSKYDLAPTPLFLDRSRRFLISKFIEGRNPNVNDIDFMSVLMNMGKSINIFRKAPISLLQRLNTGTRLCPRKFFHDVIIPTTHSLATKILLEGSPSLFQFLEEISGYLHERLHYEPKSDCIIDWEEYEKNPSMHPWGLIHNDLALRNIIFGLNNFYYVDWEFSDFGDIAYDLAYIQSENLLLEPQIRSIIGVSLKPYIQERTLRYIRIFLPMLELANAYWTLNHIANLINPQDKKLQLRSPYTITQNLQFIRWKIRRLNRLAKSSSFDEDQLFQEIQQGLKLFEAHLIIG